MVTRDGSIAVVIDSQSLNFVNYIRYIKPYLDHFGFPFYEIDMSTSSFAFSSSPALVLFGHKGCITDDIDPTLISKLLDEKTGIISFDPSIPKPFAVSLEVENRSDKSEVSIVAKHFITDSHEVGTSVKLRSPFQPAYLSALKDGTVLASIDNIPLLSIIDSANRKIVAWHDITWMSPEHLGPLGGIDDLLWRSIVWAARKPFVMQGLPYFLTMRVDDVWGSSRSGHENPLYWVDICNKYGIKPWLGLFTKNIEPTTIPTLRKQVEDGKATAFPHAFAGHDNSIPGTEIPEEWIFFDHWRRENYNNAILSHRINQAFEWHTNNNIPISKYALAHYYETGSNAIQTLIEWGCEFVGMHMNPGEPYVAEHDNAQWLNDGPFRRFVNGHRNHSLPCYYADFLSVKGNPELSGKLFNCITEIRDICGYEWAPSNDIDKTVENGITQLRRAFDSMALSQLFTHETDYIQHIAPENWETIVKRITEGIAPYKPICLTLDEACRYVRARYSYKIISTKCTDNEITLSLRGDNDIPTQVYLFTDEGETTIAKMINIPEVNGCLSFQIKMDS